MFNCRIVENFDCTIVMIVPLVLEIVTPRGLASGCGVSRCCGGVEALPLVSLMQGQQINRHRQRICKVMSLLAKSGRRRQNPYLLATSFKGPIKISSSGVNCSSCSDVTTCLKVHSHVLQMNDAKSTCSVTLQSKHFHCKS